MLIKTDLDDQQAINEIIGNKELSFIIEDKERENSDLLSIDYFSQEDVWSAHLARFGYPFNPTAIHMNGPSYDNKLLLLQAMRFWHLDNDKNCTLISKIN